MRTIGCMRDDIFFQVSVLSRHVKAIRHVSMFCVCFFLSFLFGVVIANCYYSVKGRFSAISRKIPSSDVAKSSASLLDSGDFKLLIILTGIASEHSNAHRRASSAFVVTDVLDPKVFFFDHLMPVRVHKAIFIVRKSIIQAGGRNFFPPPGHVSPFNDKVVNNIY